MDPVTCDTPFCRNCGKLINRMMVDGVRNGRRAGWVATIDYCKLHQAEEPVRGRALTAEGLAAVRDEIWARVQRLRAG
jgi:hypothetical protein